MVDADEGGSHGGDGGFPVQVRAAPEGRLGDGDGAPPAQEDVALESSERTMQMLGRLQAGPWRTLSSKLAVHDSWRSLAL